jgi:DUF971 family protein
VLVPTRIDASDPSALIVEWEDGRADRLPVELLRAACPCAGCREGGPVRPDLMLTDVHLVGDYAVGMTFRPEGHRTGIFTFELLRSLGGQGAAAPD